MPAYQTAATIGPALESVLSQSRQDFEVVVVDDGSSDDTADRVARYADRDERVRLVRQANAGLAGARNTAIAHARGELVSLLDSDDLWMPSYLEAMAAALAGDADAAFAYTDAWVFDDETRRVRRATAMATLNPPASAPREASALLSLLLEGNFIVAFATVRRSAIDAVGPFDASLRRCEDYELWLRIARAGYRAVQAPGIHALYRKRAVSLNTPATESEMRATNRELYRRVAEEWQVPDAIRAQAARRMAATDAFLRADSGERLLAGARLRLRRTLARAARPLLERRRWHSSPPPEVAATFDLHAI
jgi:glycosyltransferase involved in cell wall biosynthesis